MNKTVIGGIVGVIVLGVVVILAINFLADGETPPVPETTQNSITRPAVKPIPNTFSVMTPAEKAAADKADQLAAEAALLATSSATSTESEATDEEVGEETN
jgi:hypothetical protein